MRSEKEMFELILTVAKEDPRIRAVYMNGSRTNKQVPKDPFQDFDIVYVVTETKPFITDSHWIDRFGKRLYMQIPKQIDLLMGKPIDPEEDFGWLMQFTDGIRMDLQVQTPDRVRLDGDLLCRVLLDKDLLLPPIPEATDEDYHIHKPTEDEFIARCNEFWWCQNNVAKGLWRKEVTYVQDMIHAHIRPQLIYLLSWRIGVDTNFSVSVGKAAKYMYKWLSADHWNRFLQTYSNAVVEEMWKAVFIQCDLFHEVALEFAKKLDFHYDTEEAMASLYHLQHVQLLPSDATEIY
jgi:aminoglycoside 6-adenylyltransferase